MVVLSTKRPLIVFARRALSKINMQAKNKKKVMMKKKVMQQDDNQMKAIYRERIILKNKTTGSTRLVGKLGVCGPSRKLDV